MSSAILTLAARANLFSVVTNPLLSRTNREKRFELTLIRIECDGESIVRMSKGISTETSTETSNTSLKRKDDKNSHGKYLQ